MKVTRMNSTSTVIKDGQKHIIVIGAGVGGVAVAAQLANLGNQVTVFEKNASCGGRCSLFTLGGFRFDVGPSLYLMPEIFKETFDDLGEDVNDHIELIKCNPNYNIHFMNDGDDDDGSSTATNKGSVNHINTITLSTDLTQLKSVIDKLEPKTGWSGFLNFMREGQSHYEISEKMVLRKNFETWYDFFTGNNLIFAFQIHVFSNMWSRVSKYFKSEKLRKAFTFQSMYMGQSPYEAPGTYNLLQYTELAEGVWYPKGGYNTVIQKMEQVAKKKGAVFHYNTPVKKIILDQLAGLATGIELNDGRVIHGDIIVCNADLVWAYNHLLNDTTYGKKLSEKAFTSSTFSFYWGMNTIIKGLNSHNIFLAKDYKASFDKIFKEFDLPTDPSFYIHVPSRIDPTAAPTGKDTVTVLVPVGHINPSKVQDWPSLYKRARRAVISVLESKLGIENFESLIEVESVNTPETWRDTYNLYHGSALGLSHSLFQVGWFRPSTRHEDYGNVFFVGASTHPGTGVPVVLYCARLVTRQIRKCIIYGLAQPKRMKWIELISAIMFLILAALSLIYLPKSWTVVDVIEPDL